MKMTHAAVLLGVLLCACLQVAQLSPVQQQVPTPAIRACLTSSLRNVVYGCASQAANANASIPILTARDALIGLLLSCFSEASGQSSQGVRVLMPSGVTANAISGVMNFAHQATGIPIRLVVPSPNTYAVARLTSLQNPTKPILTHEAWIMTPANIGESKGAFMDLTDLVLYDNQLQWPGIIPQLRSVGLVYASKIISLPLSSYAYQLFYRMDTFKANNWTVPRTWTDLASMARKINGTNGMYGFCCTWGPCGQIGGILLRSMMASYHQTHGSTQGWYIDPDNMTLMLDTPGMMEALEIIQDLYRLSAPDMTVFAPSCALGNTYPFIRGACHMTISTGTIFKLPGSERVLDRPSNTLVPCDENRCPYGVRDVSDSGVVRWINYSPGFDATLISINGYTDPIMRFYTYGLMSYLARPAASDAFVFDPQTDVLPSRTSQLVPQRWADNGYNLADATRYCNSANAALNHPNIHIPTRMPGAPSMINVAGVMIVDLIASGRLPPSVMKASQINGMALFNQTYNGNLTAFKMEYWQSINKPLYQYPPSPTPPSPTPNPHMPPPLIQVNAPHQPSETMNKATLTIVLSTVIPVGILLVAVVIYFRMRGLGQAGASTWRKPPGVGPRTTLLVSDIEGSTMLWEELDAAVVDASVKLHNACIRTLAAQHKGYESLWEGDSFTIAFWDPVDAINFATQAQRQLLQLDWSPRLLRHERTLEVWIAPRRKQRVLSHKSLNLNSTVDGASSRPRATDMLSAPSERLIARQLSMAVDSSMPSASSHRTSDAPPQGTARHHSMVSLPPTILMPIPYDSSFVSLPPIATSTHKSMMSLAEPHEHSSSSLPPLQKLHSATAPTFHSQLQSEWQTAAPGTPGAMLLYRGLRVRFGFHCGLANESDMSYNTASGRWVYTGSIRVMANAVASAGLGGHILLTTSTAALLGKDTHGVLRHLPADVRAYHMGDHMLNGMSDEPVPLLLLLHRTLKPHLAMMQQSLRTLHCVRPGVLTAPTASLVAPPVLVGLKLDGLATLLAWNEAEASCAVRQLLCAVNAEISNWRGVMSEDGISISLEPTLLPARGDGLLTSAKQSKHKICPGRMVIAFPEANDAVQWAMALRLHLLTLEWGEELLKHESCEQVGINPSVADLLLLNSRFEERDVGYVSQVTGGQPTPSGASQHPFGRASLGLSFGGIPAPSPPRISQLPQASQLEIAPGNMPVSKEQLHDVEPRRMSRLGNAGAIMRSKSSLNGSGSPAMPLAMVKVRMSANGGTTSPTSTGTRCLEPAGMVLDAQGASISGTPLDETPSSSRGVDTERINALWQIGQGKSGNLSGAAQYLSVSGMHLFHSRERGRRTSDNNTGTASQASDKLEKLPDDLTVHVSDAPFLAGLRVRMAVTSGMAAVRVATRSSGRAVYHGSKSHKQLIKLLQQAHAGQILVSGAVMQHVSQVMEEE